MKLINDEGTDFSNEILVQLEICLLLLNSADYMCNRLSAAFKSIGQTRTFFSRKKQVVNECAARMKKIVLDLDKEFSGTFDSIWNKVPGQELERYEAIEWLTADTLKLMLIYNSRLCDNLEKHERMQKALLNFKPDEGVPFDLDEMLRFYNLNPKI